MKAAFIEKTGSVDVIQYGNLPQPSPGEGEVLIKVRTVSVNPIDTYIRSGMVAINLPQPYVVGCDVAGVVDATGSNTSRFQVGDRVWGTNQGLSGRQGTFSEFVTSHEDWLYPIPDGVKEEDSVAASLVGNTAHLGLFRCAKLQSDEIVFVNGGTGGVGHMVVQMAKAVGARVITTVGSEEKAMLCRNWGADLVLHYKSDPVHAAIREFTGESGIDLWYETLRDVNLERTFGLLGKRGRMVVMAGRESRPTFPTGDFYTKDLTLHGVALFNASPDEQRVCAEDINRWLTEKKLTPLIGQRYRLEETALAHQMQQDNTLSSKGTLAGKIVLTP